MTGDALSNAAKRGDFDTVRSLIHDIQHSKKRMKIEVKHMIRAADTLGAHKVTELLQLLNTLNITKLKLTHEDLRAETIDIAIEAIASGEFNFTKLDICLDISDVQLQNLTTALQNPNCKIEHLKVCFWIRNAKALDALKCIIATATNVKRFDLRNIDEMGSYDMVECLKSLPKSFSNKTTEMLFPLKTMWDPEKEIIKNIHRTFCAANGYTKEHEILFSFMHWKRKPGGFEPRLNSDLMQMVAKMLVGRTKHLRPTLRISPARS